MSRKKSKSVGLMEICGDLLKRILWLLSGMYIFLVMVIMPFHHTDGYTKIGTNKYEFFKMVTGAMAWFFVPALVLYGIWLLMSWIKEKKPISIRLSVTDKFALLYGAAVLLSYLFSPYREATIYGNAWDGATGWFMGAKSQLLFLASYFIISRFWSGRSLLKLIFPVLLIVCCLGYLNRFGVYPIEMASANYMFISTIGNMNWYCGYLVTVFFAILGFWLVTKQEDLKVGLFTALIVVGFASLVTQGSNSGIFVLMVMLVVIYLLAMKRGSYMEQFWLMCALLASACVVTLGVRKCFPEAITFQDGVMNLLTDTLLPLPLLILCLAMYFLVFQLNRKKKYPVAVFARIGYIGAGIFVAALVGYILLLTLNTLKPGSIGPLSEMGAFIFDGGWASNRGATLRAGVFTFLNQDVKGKLFGVGPDCMAMYIYTQGSEELMAILKKQFNSLTLTNAHCEWLTVLVTTGIVGAVGYIGMIVSAITRFLKQRDKQPMIFACGLGLLAFTVNNVFSFQQAMNTTTMFLVLGIGEALYRQENLE